MSLSLFGPNTDYVSYIIDQLLGIPGFMLFLCFRGFFEAWTAYKLGDDTPLQNGYLTMNPKKHINPIGFLFLIIFGFGFSNPVPTNSRHYKNIKRDHAIQILSAPFSGVILMAAASFVLYLCCFIGSKAGLLLTVPEGYAWYSGYSLLQVAVQNGGTGMVLFNAFLIILAQTARVSIYLSIFFLLPLPGFDGYRLIANFLPYKYYSALYKVEKYSIYIFIVFLLLIQFVPGIYSIVSVPAEFLMDKVGWLFSKIFPI